MNGRRLYEKVRNLYDRKDEAREKFLDMDRHVKDKKEELATVETKLQKAKQDYEPYRVNEELNLTHELFPIMKKQLRIVELCRKIGLAVESVRSIIGRYNLDSKILFFLFIRQKFTAEDVKLKIEKEPDNPNKLRLNLKWDECIRLVRQKFQEIQIVEKPEISKGREIKM